MGQGIIGDDGAAGIGPPQEREGWCTMETETNGRRTTERPYPTDYGITEQSYPTDDFGLYTMERDLRIINAIVDRLPEYTYGESGVGYFLDGSIIMRECMMDATWDPHDILNVTRQRIFAMMPDGISERDRWAGHGVTTRHYSHSTTYTDGNGNTVTRDWYIRKLKPEIAEAVIPGLRELAAQISAYMEKRRNGK